MKIIFPKLSGELNNYFLKNSQLLKFKRNQIIYNESEDPSGIFLVQSGLVALITYGTESGNEHLMRFFRPNQFFGHRSLFLNEKYHASAKALELSEIIKIPKNIILKAAEENPRILKFVIETLGKELRRCEQNRILILENQILPRVAQSIVYLKKIKPNHNWTRQEIASFCGSTTSTVIKALAKLEDMNLIEQNKREIHILNLEKLLNESESI